MHGPSGIGKTALVEHLLGGERTRGAIVLRGRCRENESIGYKAIDGLVDELVGLLSEMSEAEVRRVLPASVADLLQLFPALRACSKLLDQVVSDERGDQNLIRNAPFWRSSPCCAISARSAGSSCGSTTCSGATRRAR